jgi:hypothetical protein
MKTTTSRIALFAFNVAALVAIGAGLLMIYPPSCPLVVGLLVWIDLHL